MKTYFWFTLMIVSGFISCTKNHESEQTDNFVSLDKVITITRDFTANSSTRSSQEDFRIVATYDLETEKVLSYKIQRLEEGITTDLGISQTELDAVIMAELGENFRDLQLLEEAKGDAIKSASLMDCLSNCRKEFTNSDGSKKSGRGWCKFGCWVETVLDIFVKIWKNF